MFKSDKICPVCGHQEVSKLVTLAKFYMGRQATHGGELTEELQRNAKDICHRVNGLLHSFGIKEAKVNSGWRPLMVNRQAGGAPRSKHVTCQAIDLGDSAAGDLANLFNNNLDVLKKHHLWMEDTRYTAVKRGNEIRRWVHLQTVPPRSGRRVFIPYAGPPPEID